MKLTKTEVELLYWLLNQAIAWSGGFLPDDPALERHKTQIKKCKKLIERLEDNPAWLEQVLADALAAKQEWPDWAKDHSKQPTPTFRRPKRKRGKRSKTRNKRKVRKP